MAVSDKLTEQGVLINNRKNVHVLACDEIVKGCTLFDRRSALFPTDTSGLAAREFTLVEITLCQ